MTGRARPAFLALATGASAGCVAKWSDEHGPDWLGDLGTELSFWVFIAVLVGWLTGSLAQAAVTSAVFFVTMTASYYAWSVFVLGFSFESASLIWFALALSACPLLSASMHAARRDSPGSVALGAAAALVAASGSVRTWWLQLIGALGEEHPDHTVGGLLNVAMVVTLVLLARSPRRILLAGLAAVVLFWPVATLYGTVSSRIPLP